MNALNPSHAALVAEVTALRATLNDAVELCESLRSDRDALRVALAQHFLFVADCDRMAAACLQCAGIAEEARQSVSAVVDAKSGRDQDSAAAVVRGHCLTIIAVLGKFHERTQARAALERPAL